MFTRVRVCLSVHDYRIGNTRDTLENDLID